MDSYVTLCKEKDLINCDFDVFKNPDAKDVFYERFLDLKPIIGAYV